MWDRVLAVNVTGAFRLTRAVLPAMIAAGAGSIVNIASEAGLRGSASGNAYTTSKHAVIGMTKSAAFMYGPNGVRVNAVAPGGVAIGIPFPPHVSEAGQARLQPFQATAGRCSTRYGAARAATYAGGMTSARAALAAFAVDAVLVVLFAATGRLSHAENVLVGLWTTAWPFLLALVAGWLITRAWLAPRAVVRTGLPVWAITVAGGMVLRAAVGQGVAVSFIVVAAIVLFVLLVGWRALALLVSRRRAAATTR